MNFCKLCIVLCAAALFAAACSQTATTPNAVNTAANTNKPSNAASTPAATPADEKAMAEKLYTANCMTCHRDSGKGGKVTVDGKALDPNDLTAEKMKSKSDEKLYEYISDGAPDDGMPAFKGKLTDAEIKSIVKHVRKLQGV